LLKIGGHQFGRSPERQEKIFLRLICFVDH
jgi:hypothetical protein